MVLNLFEIFFLIIYEPLQFLFYFGHLRLYKKKKKKKKSLKKQLYKKCKYNECDSQTTRYKIILDKLIFYKNQSSDLRNLRSHWLFKKNLNVFLELNIRNCIKKKYISEYFVHCRSLFHLLHINFNN